LSSKRERQRTKKRSERLRNDAWRALARGEEALAWKLIVRALEGGPGNARSWRDQGAILVRLGRETEAEASFERATQLAPLWPESWISYVDELLRCGSRARALEILEEGLTALPDDQELRRRLAELDPDHPALRPEPPATEVQADFPWERTRDQDWIEAGEELRTRGATRCADPWRPGERELLTAWLGGAGSTQRGPRGSFGPLRRGAAPQAVHELLAEVHQRLALAAAEGRARLERRRASATSSWRPATPERSVPFVRSWHVEADDPVELPFLEDRPAFPFDLLCVLGAEVEAELLLRDARSGRAREKAYAVRDGDFLAGSARDRWVLIGQAWGLQPLKRRFACSRGSALLVQFDWNLD
jgi:tetratricopeptide (TPR) repeat protein